MTPSTSVLLLTTLTGFGYGLLAWIGAFGAVHALPEQAWFGPLAAGLALAISSAGLLASTLHLGRPERAWRAFSQWRSSWLSREGIAAVLTYLPALAFAALWWFAGPAAFSTRRAGVAAGAMGLITVACTAMIYASLKPIRHWSNGHTLPDYLLFSLFSGGLLLTLLMSYAGGAFKVAALVTGLLGLAGLIAKRAYWYHVDHAAPLATLASAIGIKGASARPLDQPHFTQNYILREMGFQVARKHADKLRNIAQICAFILPALLVIAAAFGLLPQVAALLAVLLAAFGLLVERWLYFAQAVHVATLYYGHSA